MDVVKGTLSPGGCVVLNLLKFTERLVPPRFCPFPGALRLNVEISGMAGCLCQGIHGLLNGKAHFLVFVQDRLGAGPIQVEGGEGGVFSLF